MAATVDLGRQLQLENGAYLTLVLKKKVLKYMQLGNPAVCVSLLTD